MAELDVVEAFDQISPLYDATRAPLDDSTVDKMAQELRSHGIRSVLEIGVGTGRISLPLAARGLETTGIDASMGMLARARAKGVRRLVRGTAYALPFRDRSVDTALFVHVLHLLDDPVRALREACRVGRHGATALVRPPRARTAEAENPREPDPRRLVAEILAREGHPVTGRGGLGEPGRKEGRLIESVPPDRLEVLIDRTETEPLARRLDMLRPGSSRGFLQVPPDALLRALHEARLQLGDRTRTFRRVEALATWTHPPAAGTVVAAEPPA